MAIVIKGTEHKALNGRAAHFDRAVRALAPTVVQLQQSGVTAVEALQNVLNAKGVAAPNGKQFTFGTTHRVLIRLKQLGLGHGPRSVSEARLGRPYRFYSAETRKERLSQLAKLEGANINPE
jgi:hypothetical protein